MKRIPDKLATAQDVRHVCEDADPAKARDLLDRHKHLLDEDELGELRRRLAAKKRAQTIAAKEARRRWERFHELAMEIDETRRFMAELQKSLSGLTRELRRLEKERRDLAALLGAAA